MGPPNFGPSPSFSPLAPLPLDPYVDRYAGSRRPSLLDPSAGTRFGQLPEPARLSHTATVVPYGDLTGNGGDVHDTFKLDRYGNVYSGHTSVKIPAAKPFHINWDE
jgi:hypothetical protein